MRFVLFPLQLLPLLPGRVKSVRWFARLCDAACIAPLPCIVNGTCALFSLFMFVVFVHARARAHDTQRTRTHPQAEVVGNGRGNNDGIDDDEDDDDDNDLQRDYRANFTSYGAPGGVDAAGNAEAEDMDDDVQARVSAYGRLSGSGKTNKVTVPSLPKPRAQKVRLWLWLPLLLLLLLRSLLLFSCQLAD